MNHETTALALYGMTFAKELYRDVAKPIVTVLSRVAARKLDAALNKIPKKDRVVPDKETAIPALTGLCCTDDGSILQDMYIKLLAQAADKRKKKNTHPAFGHVIQQMSRDEAVLLMILRDNPTWCLKRAEMHSLPANKTVTQDTIFMDKKIVKEHRIDEDRLVMYFEHLLNLNLLEWQARPSRLKMSANGTLQDIDPKIVGPTQYPHTNISKFGRCFIETCLPDKFPAKRKRKPRERAKT
jgi:Abortive infection alpha